MNFKIELHLEMVDCVCVFDFQICKRLESHLDPSYKFLCEIEGNNDSLGQFCLIWTHFLILSAVCMLDWQGPFNKDVNRSELLH